MTSPMLWYANRGTGLVLLILFTATVVLGLMSSRSGGGRSWWPRFVTQGLHRHLSLLSSLLLVLHVVSAVIDDYVAIDWWHALVPFGGSYRPVYLALGAVAVDLTVVLLITSLLRQRLPDRAWRALHLVSYPAWAASVVHTIGIATDIGTPWLRALLIGCVATVVIAAGARTMERRLAGEQP